MSHVLCCLSQLVDVENIVIIELLSFCPLKYLLLMSWGIELNHLLSRTPDPLTPTNTGCV